MPAQTFDLPLEGGLAEAVDRKVVKPGSFLKLTNVEHEKQGALVKRRGYGALGVVAGAGAVERVATRGQDLVGFADGLSVDQAPSVYAYDAAEDAWARHGDAWSVDYGRRVVGRSLRGALLGQRVVIGNRVVFFWVESLTSGTLVYRVESKSGTLIKPNALFGVLAPGGKFKLMTTNGLAVVVYYPGSGATLRLATLDPTTFAETDVNLPGVPYVVGAARQVFDAKAMPLAPGFVAVATRTAPTLTTQQIHLSSVEVATGSPFQLVTGSTSGGDFSSVQIRFTDAGTKAGVAFRRKNDVTARDDIFVAQFSGFAANGTFNPIADYEKVVFDVSDAIETGANIARSFGAHLCHVADINFEGWVVVTCNNFGTLAKRLDDAGDVVGNDDYVISNATLLAEPFALGGRVFALVGALINGTPGFVFGGGSNAVGTAALVSLFPGIDAHDGLGVPDPDTRYVAAVGLVESVTGAYLDQLGRASGLESGRGIMVPSFNADDSVSFAATVAVSGTGPDAGLGVDEITFSLAGTQTTFADTGRALATSGGLTARYDGRAWAEVGFLHRPLLITASVQSTGGSMANGSYLYAFVYEWQDDAGEVHQSEPSISGPIVLSAGTGLQKIDFTIRCLGLTQKAPVAIVVYRSQSNGSLLFRISPRTLDGSALSIESECGVFSKPFTDTLSDAQLAALGRGFLYTNGGARANVLAPPSRHAVRHGGRLWLVSSDADGEIWFSKEFAQNEGVAFGRGNRVRIDGLPGPILALASSDDKLFALTASSIHYIVGKGPNDTGQGGEFVVFDVATDGGCIDARSVAVTTFGVFFQGAAGIMLLTRSLEVQFAGAPVEDTTAAYPVCRRAVVDATARRVYWLFSKADLSDSVYVVFDYDAASWYVWAVAPTANQRDQTLWRGEHVVNDGRPALRGFGLVPGADPDGSYVPMTIETPEIRGLQRAVLSGERLHPHSLRVEVFSGLKKSNTPPSQDRVYDLSTASVVKGLPDAQLEVNVKSQEAASSRLRITDAPAAGTTNAAGRTGFALSVCTVDVEVTPGLARVAPENKR